MNAQMAKFVNRPKGAKGCKLLALEGHFSPGGEKTPAEPSNLCRIVLRANDTTGLEPTHLTANIPMAEVPSILELTRLALNDFMTEKKLKFNILDGQPKPKVSDKTDEGTLVYDVDIVYDSSRICPITINISNFRADVETVAGGRMKYSAPKTPRKNISLVLKPKEFYNAVSHIEKMYETWCTKAAANGAFDEAF